MAKIPVAEMLFLCEERTLEWRVFVFQFLGGFLKMRLIVSEGGAHVKILSFDYLIGILCQHLSCYKCVGYL